MRSNILPFPSVGGGTPGIDGALVRGLLGLPAGSDDQAVNEAVAQLYLARKGVKQTGPAAKTFDAHQFRNMLGIDPAMTDDQVNSELRRFIMTAALDEADGDPTDADAIVRKRLGIDPGVWARYGDPAKPVALSAHLPLAQAAPSHVLTINVRQAARSRVAAILADYHRRQ